MKIDRNDIIFGIVCTVCLIVFLFTFPGCKEIQYVPVYQQDTLIINNYVRDSIKLYDSVYVFKEADSVFIYKEKIAYKDRLVHDTIIHTIYKEKPVEVTKTVEVNKPYSIWEKILMWSGVAFIICVVGIVMYHLKK